MIAHIHVTNQFSPPEHTRNTLQAEYWILHAHAQIRNVCKSCYACRRQLAYGIQPEMAALPYNRFPSEKPFPFQNTGQDVFGPFASQIANTYNKRYRLILTCQLHVPCTSKFVKTSPPMPPSVRFGASLLDEEPFLQLFVSFLETLKFFGTSTQHLCLTSEAYGNASSEA